MLVPELVARVRGELARWAPAAHVIVAPTGGRRGAVDAALEDVGLERRVALAVPSFLAALAIVARTDLVLTTPTRLAKALAPVHDLVTFAPPVALESFDVAMLWHSRTHLDPAHRWLRGAVAAAAATVCDSDDRDRTRGASPRGPVRRRR